MDAPGNQMRRATAILGAQRLYWDPEPLPERPQPLATSASSPRSSPRGWGAPRGAHGRAPGRAPPGQGSDGWLARNLTAGWPAGWLMSDLNRVRVCSIFPSLRVVCAVKRRLLPRVNIFRVFFSTLSCWYGSKVQNGCTGTDLA